MEIEGYDIRLAVLKINDFLDTLGDAYLSLTYANPKEHKSATKKELIIIRRIHLRHAVIDLNNSFDLLIQILWFYYRMWQEFNPQGALHSNWNNNGWDYIQNPRQEIEITRNIDGWVEQVEESCSLKKVLLYMGGKTDSDILKLKEEIEIFRDEYIFNENKKFTVRTIVNQIKHKHSLKIKELYEPYDFNVNINSTRINLREANLGMNYNVDFFELTKPNKAIGNIDINYKDDLYLDIEYASGEKFRAKDYLKEDFVYTIDEIHSEVVDYTNSLINLYEKLSTLIDSTLDFNPLMENTKFKSSAINLDKFFK